ncbi:MAG: response regulator [Methanoregula sp.]|nr:response regulator [Methanoregula sp.]
MSEKPRVMIVDDDENLCRTLSLVLNRKGYDVTVAHSGPEAIGNVEEQSFAMIFMDIKMPGMDGVEAFEQIQKIRTDAVVTMMTAYAVEGLVEKALYMGAQGILYKPVDVKNVMSTIEDVSRELKGLNILVVDDDCGTAITLKNILARHGHAVNTASSGEAAIRMAQQQPPEIALIDMKLPGINGLEAYLAMKKDNPDMTAVMMTGYRQDMAPMLETALKADAYTVLYKPLEMGALLRIVNELSRKKTGMNNAG